MVKFQYHRIESSPTALTKHTRRAAAFVDNINPNMYHPVYSFAKDDWRPIPARQQPSQNTVIGVVGECDRYVFLQHYVFQVVFFGTAPNGKIDYGAATLSLFSRTKPDSSEDIHGLISFYNGIDFEPGTTRYFFKPAQLGETIYDEFVAHASPDWSNAGVTLTELGYMELFVDQEFLVARRTVLGNQLNRQFAIEPGFGTAITPSIDFQIVRTADSALADLVGDASNPISTFRYPPAGQGLPANKDGLFLIAYQTMDDSDSKEQYKLDSQRLKARALVCEGLCAAFLSVASENAASSLTNAVVVATQGTSGGVVIDLRNQPDGSSAIEALMVQCTGLMDVQTREPLADRQKREHTPSNEHFDVDAAGLEANSAYGDRLRNANCLLRLDHPIIDQIFQELYQ